MVPKRGPEAYTYTLGIFPLYKADILHLEHGVETSISKYISFSLC